jgi:hypothetical protein
VKGDLNKNVLGKFLKRKKRSSVLPSLRIQKRSKRLLFALLKNMTDLQGIFIHYILSKATKMVR